MISIKESGGLGSRVPKAHDSESRSTQIKSLRSNHRAIGPKPWQFPVSIGDSGEGVLLGLLLRLLGTGTGRLELVKEDEIGVVGMGRVEIVGWMDSVEILGGEGGRMGVSGGTRSGGCEWQSQEMAHYTRETSEGNVKMTLYLYG